MHHQWVAEMISSFHTWRNNVLETYKVLTLPHIQAMPSAQLKFRKWCMQILCYKTSKFGMVLVESRWLEVYKIRHTLLMLSVVGVQVSWMTRGRRWTRALYMVMLLFRMTRCGMQLLLLLLRTTSRLLTTPKSVHASPESVTPNTQH